MHEHDAEYAPNDNLYPFAAYLGSHFQADWIIDIGCGRGENLSRYASDFFIAGIDTPANIAHCRATYDFGSWLEADLEEPGPLPLSSAQLAGSVVICSDVIGHLVDPRPLVRELDRIRKLAAAVLISTPDRDRVRAANYSGAPADQSHARDWNADEFGEFLTASDLSPTFLGFTTSNHTGRQKDMILAIVEGRDTPPLEKAPDAFRVLAVVTGHNERDIVPYTLRRLVDDGLEVVYVDNWSTDGTLDVVASEFSNFVRSVRFPETETKTYDWATLLSYVETVAKSSSADWVIHHDADEIREGPWLGLGLRDSIWNVDRRGFNAINHQVINFRPVSEKPDAGQVGDPAETLVWWQHPSPRASPVHVKGWRNMGQRVRLVETGGHEARFSGRRIFPYRFLLRHYPLRSPEHARRKIFSERADRWNEQERKLGWHTQYDDADLDDTFLWPKAVLHEWDPRTFVREFLTERLTGVGVLHDEADDAPVELVSNPPTPARIELRRLWNRCDELTSHAEWLESQLAQEGERRTEAERLAADVSQRLSLISGSRSWTLTRPLRVLAARLRAAVQARR